ncbi:MAG: UvrB/UvrC motif-containing protein [Clostridioides difficile]
MKRKVKHGYSRRYEQAAKLRDEILQLEANDM